MPVRIVSILLVIGVLGLGFVAWMSTQDRSKNAPPAASDGAGTTAAPPADVQPPAAADPGVHWTAPSRWTEGQGSSMRLATYAVPAASGDAGGAECAVFYFGPGQGGSISDNLQRWAGEFGEGAKPELSTRTVAGLKVSRLAVSGGYHSHGGSMGQAPSAAEPNQGLLGAIVEGPAGPVFFKLTGPAKTVAAASAEFDRMIGSLHAK